MIRRFARQRLAPGHLLGQQPRHSNSTLSNQVLLAFTCQTAQQRNKSMAERHTKSLVSIFQNCSKGPRCGPYLLHTPELISNCLVFVAVCFVFSTKAQHCTWRQNHELTANVVDADVLLHVCHFSSEKCSNNKMKEIPFEVSTFFK